MHQIDVQKLEWVDFTYFSREEDSFPADEMLHPKFTFHFIPSSSFLDNLETTSAKTVEFKEEYFDTDDKQLLQNDLYFKRISYCSDKEAVLSLQKIHKLSSNNLLGYKEWRGVEDDANFWTAFDEQIADSANLKLEGFATLYVQRLELNYSKWTTTIDSVTTPSDSKFFYFVACVNAATQDDISLAQQYYHYQKAPPTMLYWIKYYSLDRYQKFAEFDIENVQDKVKYFQNNTIFDRPHSLSDKYKDWEATFHNHALYFQ